MLARNSKCWGKLTSWKAGIVEVYHVTFTRDHWRIAYEGQYFGEYATVEAASTIACLIAQGELARGLITHVVVDCKDLPLKQHNAPTR